MSQFKSFLRSRYQQALCLSHSAGRLVGLSRPPQEPVSFVSEKADWAIRWVGQYIKYGIDHNHPGFVNLTTDPQRLSNQIVHFGSQYMWLSWGKHLPQNNKFVTSFFHGKPEDGPEVAKHIDQFLANADRLSKVIVSASLIKERMIDWGVNPNKIAHIPIGCDTGHFRPPTEGERQDARKRLGVPEGAICIGSFQKDGVGWGDGMEPKYIKGPDVFVEAVRQLAKNYPVYVLLSGPARGYVKAGLEKHGIPYHHSFLEDYKDVAGYHHALDLYLVTSREEGGPMALMEAMASHVSVISTNVGQAQDLLTGGLETGLVGVDDIEQIVQQSAALIDQNEQDAQVRKIIARVNVISGFDWYLVADRHYEEVYLPLSQDNR